MSSKDTRPSVFMMKAEAASIEEIAAYLLKETQPEHFPELSDGEKGRLEEETSFFFNELTTIILNWISAARTDEIEDLFIALEKAVAANSSENQSETSIHAWLSTHLDALAYVLRAVLRTENLAKYMGELSGKRRAAWGELLANLYEANRPVSREDARDFVPSLKNPNTVYHVLERMTEMGLLEKISSVGSNRVSYAVSWPGRMVARAWRELHPETVSESENDTTAYVDVLLDSAQNGSPVSSWDKDNSDRGKISQRLVMTAKKS